ncbi:MAG: hypothetical protein BGO98_25875 [Myxococcales bacterium 68-20]|nr:hypothetical protein [Myxococcales bacterium]OJY16076.1 MAG: hypothetical protein BGO98_25875 [Myxococcales bacterium 68-20]
MSKLEPLLDSDLPEDLASVLRSAKADGPRDQTPAQARTLAAVAAHHAARSNAGNGRASSGMPFAKTMLSLVAACVAGAALFSAFGSDAPGGETSAPPSLPSAPSSSLPSPSLSTEGMRVDDLPSAPVEEAAPKAAPSVARRGGAVAELEDELALIDAARAALAAKHPETTLARVDAYHRRFRAGQFIEEADALEIQALAAIGRQEEATAKGQRFLAAHPGSAYQRRVKSALGLEVTP